MDLTADATYVQLQGQSLMADHHLPPACKANAFRLEKANIAIIGMHRQYVVESACWST